MALVCAPSYIAGDRTAWNRSAKRERLEQREVHQRTDRVAEECLNIFYIPTPKSTDNQKESKMYIGGGALLLFIILLVFFL